MQQATRGVSQAAETDLGTVRRLAMSFELSLGAQNKAPRTISTYLAGVERLASFLERTGMPTTLVHIRREHVEAWVADELERTSAATAAIRYRSVQQFLPVGCIRRRTNRVAHGEHVAADRPGKAGASIRA